MVQTTRLPKNLMGRGPFGSQPGRIPVDIIGRTQGRARKNLAAAMGALDIFAGRPYTAVL
jgi:hypothetical protein